MVRITYRPNRRLLPLTMNSLGSTGSGLLIVLPLNRPSLSLRRKQPLQALSSGGTQCADI